jgi:hypothetical protein
MFGTYIRPGELIVYPFFEYYKDEDFEYMPSEFGYAGEEDYRGKFHASEGLIFLSYGISDRFAFEMEAAIIDASFEKSPTDPSAVPAKIDESGWADEASSAGAGTRRTSIGPSSSATSRP